MKLPLATLLLLISFFTVPSQAQKKEEEKPNDVPKDEKSEKSEKKDEKEKKSLEEILEKCEAIPGLFTLHRNKEDGTVFLEISNDQFDREYIHFSHTLDGIPDLGSFRGQFTRSKIFRVTRYYNKIEFVAENTSFYFNPDSAISKAASANISDAILASEEIEASSKDKTRHLVKADSLFLKEYFRQIKPGKSGGDSKKKEFSLGELSKERTRFSEIKSFPDNTLFRVNYVYENARPEKEGEEDVADSRYVTIRIQHSLMAVPENDYEARIDDPRVGFFTTQVTDLTSKSSAPYRDLVRRWHLKKKNPDAELSDPVEPIVWWIENTTPVELRDTIRDAVLGWNLAFESAGFSNAVQVKVQPDDADWDSDDVNYHVLRWTSSPNPPFGGYGPSFANPRTGQILGADIMLEYLFLTNRIRFRELLGTTSEENSQFPFNRQNSSSGYFCNFGHFHHMNSMAAKAALTSLGNGEIEVDALMKQGLTDLILHEVGHTLGLNHNFKSSHLYDRETIHNKELTSKTGIIGSVMDYAPASIAVDREKQGHYYSIVPGPYDHWAIRFGYSSGSDEDLVSILSESTKPEHAFGNDADDMRSPGSGIDPRAMINDLTSEPIENAIDSIVFSRKTMAGLTAKFPKDGGTYHELTTAFASLLYMHKNATETISRFVGGVYVDRAVKGQQGASPTPLNPVSGDDQRKAMLALTNFVFSPDAFNFPEDLVAHLQLQRRGFSLREIDDNEDPKIHARVLAIQEEALDQLLHKHTLTRIIDTKLYGNEYSLEEMMTDLHAGIMKGDPDNTANSFREALQIEYVERLIKISGLKDSSSYSSQARGQAIYLLTALAEDNDTLPNRHKVHLDRLIKKALEGE